MAINDKGDILSAVHCVYIQPSSAFLACLTSENFVDPVTMREALNDPKSEILLGLRSEKKSYGPRLYSLPAGHLQYGEGMEHALLREMWEEVHALPLASQVGSSSQPGGMMPTPSFCRLGQMGQLLAHGEKIHCYEHTLFGCMRWSGDVINKEPEDCLELQWYRMEQLPENMLDITCTLIHAAVHGRERVLHGFDAPNVRRCFSVLSAADALKLSSWIDAVKGWADQKAESSSYALDSCSFAGENGLTRLPASYAVAPVSHRVRESDLALLKSGCHAMQEMCILEAS